MRSVRISIALLSSIMLLLGIQATTPEPSYACSCGISTDWNLRLQHFGAIFAGEVISVKDTNNEEFLTSQLITFKVFAAWKGVSTSQITIYSDKAWGGGCGVGFTVGERWLISTSGDGGRVGTCQLPMALERAYEALAALGNPTYGSLQALYGPSSQSLLTTGEQIELHPLNNLLQYVLPIVLVVMICLIFLMKLRRSGRT